MSLNWKLRLHMDISGFSRHKANRQKKRDMVLAVASGHRDVELLLYRRWGAGMQMKHGASPGCLLRLHVQW